MLQFFLTFLAAFHWFLVIFCYMLQSFKDYNLFKGGQCSLYHQKGTFDVLEIHKIKYLRLNHLHFKFRYFLWCFVYFCRTSWQKKPQISNFIPLQYMFRPSGIDHMLNKTIFLDDIFDIFNERKLCLHDFLSIHKKWKFEPFLFSLLLLAWATRDMFLFYAPPVARLVTQVCFLFLFLFLGGRVPPISLSGKLFCQKTLAELGITPPPLNKKIR